MRQYNNKTKGGIKKKINIKLNFLLTQPTEQKVIRAYKKQNISIKNILLFLGNNVSLKVLTFSHNVVGDYQVTRTIVQAWANRGPGAGCSPKLSFVVRPTKFIIHNLQCPCFPYKWRREG